MSRNIIHILEDLCTPYPISDKMSSDYRYPHSCYMIVVGHLASHDHLQQLTEQIQFMENIEGTELFLEYVTLHKNKDATGLITNRMLHFVYEDNFNQFVYEKVKSKLSFEKLKDVCRYYETRPGVNVDSIMAQHEKRTANSTPYFINKDLSLEDAQAAALALSFYTGTNSEYVSQSASLVVRQSNGHILSEEEMNEFDEVQVILYYLVKALSHIPFHWGWTTRAVKLTDDELKYYIPGSLITWIQFSSSKDGHEVAPTFNFAHRNTHFRVYSLTGRSIKEFSNFENEEEVLFLPHSTFLVLKHEISFHGLQHIIYMRQVELGLTKWSILWVDDQIFNESWENKSHMENAAARSLNLNVHFIPKSSTENGLSFLRSPFGQRLKNQITFRIVTDMHRENENPAYNAGARLIKELRELGFENECLVFTSYQERVESIIQLELNSEEQRFVSVTTHVSHLTKFINFE